LSNLTWNITPPQGPEPQTQTPGGNGDVSIHQSNTYDAGTTQVFDTASANAFFTVNLTVTNNTNVQGTLVVDQTMRAKDAIVDQTLFIEPQAVAPPVTAGHGQLFVNAAGELVYMNPAGVTTVVAS
jgi:hypothetical protein